MNLLLVSGKNSTKKMKQLFKFLLLPAIGIALFSRCEQDHPSLPEPDDQIPKEVVIKPNDFLSGENYDRLIVEVASVKEFEPTGEALNNLKAFLESRLNKNGGIGVVPASIPSPGKAAYSLDDIKKIEQEYRTLFSDPEDKKLTAWFFFADVDYAENEGDSKVLGIAYGPTSMVIFEKTVREFSGERGQPSTPVLETTVTEHEFGHILGLVNNGTKMVVNHQDVTHGKHCNNPDCLMYWAAEHSGPVINFLTGGIIPALDQNCLNDLITNGGK